MNIDRCLLTLLYAGPSNNIYLVTLVNTLIKGVCLLLVGSVSDTVGRRYFMIGGQTCGLIGAILSATSKNVTTLIGASVFTGIAGSAQVLYPLLSQEIVPNKYRGWSQGVITLLVLPSIGFGPIIGRTMVANLSGSWRCGFSTTWLWNTADNPTDGAIGSMLSLLASR